MTWLVLRLTFSFTDTTTFPGRGWFPVTLDDKSTHPQGGVLRGVLIRVDSEFWAEEVLRKGPLGP